MKIAARLAGVVVLAMLLAWGVSWLPEIGPKTDRPVFQTDKTVRLTQLNLVDGLVALPLELGIAKADFRQSVLSVDLFLPKGVSGARFVYHDLYELTRFAWESTSNVDHLLVRILVEEGTDRRDRELLLAMEAKRTQADLETNGSDSGGTTAAIRSYLESRYHFSYTPRWREQS